MRAFRKHAYRAGCILVSVLALPLVSPAFGNQDKKEPDKSSPPPLSAEEREIIKDREMLENLTLLQDLDAIDFIDLLDEMDPDWSENGKTADSEETKEEGGAQ
jgi:hypothetical protein